MPNFITTAELKAIITPRSQNLSSDFVTIYEFLKYSPDTGCTFRGKEAPEIGSGEYFSKLADKFIASREPKGPKAPETVPDEMVSFILHHYFDIEETKLEQIKVEHSLSMGAENMVGDLLERYISSVLKDKGWVWCSGSVTRAIDFIKKDGDNWILLQVKNRDNSENSSSSSVRTRTTILKWFRTFSKKQETNWENFPDKESVKLLNEEDFKAFVKGYLAALKNESS